ncbi:M14 family metallopeptidase [Paraburkholderia sp. IMGN_8]|uniref:M14 family metallopeptidase n=1 Tax=Paraburkholderia sp. IMGN_8 TaxID=3136564 RepID=UPI0031011142
MTTLEALRATLPSYPIELDKPDIRRWRTGQDGIDYVQSFDSGVAGPHVMINALTHGNEMCGAIALDILLASGLRPSRGRLTLSFANVAAYDRFDPTDPDATRYIDEDMNRLWAPEKLDGPDDSLELRRARELRPLIDTVDFLFDIHSMHEKSEPLILTGPLAKGVALARQMAAPAHLMIDEGHAAGRRLRDYGGFGDPNSSKNALLIECGQHFEQAGRDVALDAVCRFLTSTGVIDSASVAPWMKSASPLRPQCIRVTHAVTADSTDFRFTDDFRGMEVIAEAGTLIAVDGARRIVTPYDNCVLLQPSLRHLGKGVTVVRLGKLDYSG